jgi:hypothetical protein
MTERKSLGDFVDNSPDTAKVAKGKAFADSKSLVRIR